MNVFYKGIVKITTSPHENMTEPGQSISELLKQFGKLLKKQR